MEPWRRANPDRRTRWSRRIVVRRYEAAVAALCATWRLNAWWATGLIVHQHFLELAGFPWATTDDVIVGTAHHRETCRIIAWLPRASDPDFARDEERFAGVATYHLLDDDLRPIQVVSRPPRERIAELEREQSASCVVVDWDGTKRLKSRKRSGDTVDISRFIEEECELRIGRPSKVRESQELRGQIAPQIRAARAQLLQHGWVVAGRFDPCTVARWVATRVLYGKTTTYGEIATAEQDQGNDTSDADTIRKACQLFAARAGLTLP